MKTGASLGIITILTAFFITYILGFIIIPILKKLKAGQTTKEIGPLWHKSKTGTPTMGGIILIFGVIVSSSLATVSFYFLKNNLHFSHLMLNNHELTRLFSSIFCSLALGVIGFMDDYIKVIHKQNKGLSAIQKTILQLIVIVTYFITLKINNCINTTVNIPFFGQVNFKIFYYIISIVGMHGIVNAVNLTDGLDGLVSSITSIYAIFFIIITNIVQSFSMNIIACSLLGSCLGFLIWNFYPAKIFMGDTGSMFLGGLVATLGFGVNEPFLILIVGIIYVVEAMSVVIQVIYFKITHGKRIFKMSPIHHHFELSGFSEIKILILFSIVSTIFGLIAISFIKTV